MARPSTGLSLSSPPGVRRPRRQAGSDGCARHRRLRPLPRVRRSSSTSRQPTTSSSLPGGRTTRSQGSSREATDSTVWQRSRCRRRRLLPASSSVLSKTLVSWAPRSGRIAALRPSTHPALDPVLATAGRLGVPLMLHPYYVGPKPGLEAYYLTNSIGNPLDTCVAAARLMHSGAFDRHADLRIVLVHAGGFLPYQLGRLDHAFSVRREAKVGTARPPSSYLDRFWFDTITHSDASLEFLVSLVGPRTRRAGHGPPLRHGRCTPAGSARTDRHRSPRPRKNGGGAATPAQARTSGLTG